MPLLLVLLLLLLLLLLDDDGADVGADGAGLLEVLTALLALVADGAAPSVRVLIHWGPNFITVPDMV